jgi:ABC-type nitrate/sulfonate/bicarbonate transport system substrate-binding protein
MRHHVPLHSSIARYDGRTEAEWGTRASAIKQREDDMKSKWALAGAACLIPVLLSAAAVARSLEKVTAVIPQNSVFILNWNGAKDAGVFSKHGIDLTVDARPFAGFLAGLPSKASMATTYSGIDAVLKMTQGMDLVVIGGGLTVFQQVYVPKNSPIKTIADLRGKKFGVWSTGAGAFKATRAAIKDAAGIDVLTDTNIVQVAAPALFKLAEKGEVDAMLNISSFTIEAESEPDKFRAIFSPNDYWKKKTGYPLVWSAPLVAWKSWVEENPTRAKNYSAAVMDSFRWLRKPENLDAAVKKYGKLAGVTSPAAVAVYKRWLGEKKIFLAQWNQKIVDAQWAFLEMAKKYGILAAVPDKKQHALVLGG